MTQGNDDGQTAAHIEQAGSRDFGSEVHGDTGEDRWARGGYGFETLAIHAGQDPDPTTGAVVVPIYQTSTYVQSEVGQHQGYEYSRSGNPTRTALETCLAALEGGRHGPGLRQRAGGRGLRCCARSVGARRARRGARTTRTAGRTGCSRRCCSRWGDRAHAGAPWATWPRCARRCGPRPVLVWCETPTNPLLGVADIAGLAGLAHDGGARLVVDNTFASPYLQQPLALGADVVVHSTTKYLGGHSDVVGGALVASDVTLGEELAYHQNAMGGVPGAFDSWLVLRGAKTLGVRMDRHCANAARIVDLLSAHPAVASVLYPGLPDHPGHEIAAKQMSAYGGMVSFRLAAGEAAALEVCRRTEVFTLGESLGGVESLIEHPARMTHASVAGSQLEVPDDLIRLSVGIETAEDLLADLEQALSRS